MAPLRAFQYGGRFRPCCATTKKALNEDQYEESGLCCWLCLPQRPPLVTRGTRTRSHVNGHPTNGFDDGPLVSRPRLGWRQFELREEGRLARSSVIKIQFHSRTLRARGAWSRGPRRAAGARRARAPVKARRRVIWHAGRGRARPPLRARPSWPPATCARPWPTPGPGP